jgi:hypothetical protein
VRNLRSRFRTQKAQPPQELQPFDDLQPVEATAVRAAAANMRAKKNLRIGIPSMDGESRPGSSESGASPALGKCSIHRDTWRQSLIDSEHQRLPYFGEVPILSAHLIVPSRTAGCQFLRFPPPV